LPGKTIDPSVLRNKLEDYGNEQTLRDALKVAEHRQRNIWQAFSAALFSQGLQTQLRDVLFSWCTH
jgi:hypothetical protein